MPYVNRVILVGELSANAEGRSIPNSEDVVVNLRLQTRERFPDRAIGELREVSDYHRVVVFGRLAEQARSLKKGMAVSVEGRLRTRKYQTDGQDRYITEVNAEKLSFDLPATGNDVSDRGEHSNAGHPGNPESAWDQSNDSGPPY